MTHPTALGALLIVVLAAMATIGCRPTGAAAPAIDLPPVDQLPAVDALPDPFLMRDGTRVKTLADWSRRREELKAMILFYEFGQMPPSPGAPAAKELSTNENETLGATEKHLLMTLGKDKKVEYHLDLTIPRGKSGRLPVIVTGDLGWGKVKEPIVKEIMRRGYILAEFNREEVAPDKPDRSIGVFTLYPECDWGAESAWAWGYHRTIDYLLTLSNVDAKHVAITGHSRGGKAALLAGATDERIALTVPNGSGAGGAGLYRIRGAKSEGLDDVGKRFPFWFNPRFQGFVGQVNRLPFDHHEIRALVAPRAQLSTEALGDLWANPEGTEQAYLAAREVYAFLGAKDTIGINFREGKHEQNLEDWTALLDFADLQFFGKAAARPFDKRAFPDSPRGFSWSAPPTPAK